MADFRFLRMPFFLVHPVHMIECIMNHLSRYNYIFEQIQLIYLNSKNSHLSTYIYTNYQNKHIA